MSGFDRLPPPAKSEIDAIDAVKKAPLILVLDRSSSMSGRPMKAVNDGVRTLVEELTGDEIAAYSVEIAVVSFGSDVTVDAGFANVGSFTPPKLKANGTTSLGKALVTAARMAEDRHQDLKAAGKLHYVPWIWLVTDGYPTDDWQPAAAVISDGAKAKRWVFWAVGTDEADFDVLRQCSTPDRPPMKLREDRWAEMFAWLTATQLERVKTRPGEQMALPHVGWGQVEA